MNAPYPHHPILYAPIRGTSNHDFYRLFGADDSGHRKSSTHLHHGLINDGIHFLGELLFTGKISLIRMPSIGNLTVERLETFFLKRLQITLPESSSPEALNALSGASSPEEKRNILIGLLGYTHNVADISFREALELLPPFESYKPAESSVLEAENVVYNVIVPLTLTFTAAVSDKTIPQVTPVIIADAVGQTIDEHLAGKILQHFSSTKDPKEWLKDNEAFSRVSVKVNEEKTGLEITLSYKLDPLFKAAAERFGLEKQIKPLVIQVAKQTVHDGLKASIS